MQHGSRGGLWKCLAWAFFVWRPKYCKVLLSTAESCKELKRGAPCWGWTRPSLTHSLNAHLKDLDFFVCTSVVVFVVPRNWPCCTVACRKVALGQSRARGEARFWSGPRGGRNGRFPLPKTWELFLHSKYQRPASCSLLPLWHNRPSVCLSGGGFLRWPSQCQQSAEGPHPWMHLFMLV